MAVLGNFETDDFANVAFKVRSHSLTYLRRGVPKKCRQVRKTKREPNDL